LPPRLSAEEASMAHARRAPRGRIVGLLVFGCSLVLAAPAFAEPGYPNRPVRIMVGFGPGGVADVTMRMLAQKLSERLGQQFIVDNRPGAGGILAHRAVLSGPPDGYTLVVSGNGSAITKTLFQSLPYDVLNDFTPISVTAFLDLLIVTKADGPLKSVKDIITAARANPGKLNFGTVAPGSTQHLSAELFRMKTDINVARITYRTSPDLVNALLRGDVDVIFEYYAGVASALPEGKIRAVASTGDKRSPWSSDVPTVAESGVADYVVWSWNALAGPAGMPRDVIDLLNREVNVALRDPELQRKARLFGLDARGTTPEEMDQRMRTDIAKWAEVIEKAGLQKQ
jgi:tripartite-type tricarboxylate transporter receptor subunit TctC